MNTIHTIAVFFFDQERFSVGIEREGNLLIYGYQIQKGDSGKKISFEKNIRNGNLSLKEIYPAVTEQVEEIHKMIAEINISTKKKGFKYA